MRRGWVVAAGVACVAMAGVFGAVTYRGKIAPIAPPARSQFDAGLIRRGAVLAALGDCNTCHTVPGGTAFAGGLAIPTPFGTIYSTNITPDALTGIGSWSFEAFRRALREGVDRAGRHLYPAFPYDYYTLVSDDDIGALYAFLMTRAPVDAPARANALPFPLNLRPVLAGWKFLFLRRGPFIADPTHDATWNRGAYLVEGVGHCGACHTPRNLFGAEKSRQAFAGGNAEGWRAFAINAASRSPVPWTVETLTAYLRQGWHALHGVARGPMAPVTDNLATVPDADIHAMAVYVAAMMGEPSSERQRRGETLAAASSGAGLGSRPQSAGSQTVVAAVGEADAGALIYQGACASCHDSGRPVPYGALNLALSTAISADTPRNLLNVVLGGVAPADGKPGPIMPPFAAALSDAQTVVLARFLRRSFSRNPAWPDLDDDVRAARADLMALPVPAAPTTALGEAEPAASGQR